MDQQYFKDLLHDRDLKATSTRIKLLLEMDAYKSAIPYSAIQAAMKSIDRVTLYRTLEILKEKGIIHVAFQGRHDTHYAICSLECDKHKHQHNHIHFKCIECKSVTCEKTSETINVSIPYNEIHNISIHVEGLCAVCKQKNSVVNN